LLGRSLTEGYPGPLVIAGIDGTLYPLNDSGLGFVPLLDGALREQLDALMALASEAGVAQSDAVRLLDERLGTALSIFVVPLDRIDGHATTFFVLGRDATLDSNLREALVESRQRYKDLVECSSDFVWETGADGSFEFVTTRGALGFSPEELIGRSARVLLDRRRTAPTALPFESREPVEDVEVWFRDAQGNACCMLVSCVPLYGLDGAWEGARGICKDVTAVRMRDEALARARAREALLARIVRTIRDEVEPDRLLDAASTALLEAFDASVCWIFRAVPGEQLLMASHQGQSQLTPPELARLGGITAAIEEIDGAGGTRLFAAPTVYRERRNGVICIGRSDRRMLDDDERDLLRGIANQLGIALQQIEAQETLLALSRTDELTGLLNRRAFVGEIEARLARTVSSGPVGALLYVDLDNFKAVNDERGHHQGDAALKALANFLRTNVRDQDATGRLGGDEFAVWLDGADAAVASNKAEALGTVRDVLAPFSEGLARPLGTSIGIAVYDSGSGEELTQFFARADAAMYQAKQGGKGRYAVAAPSREFVAEESRG
jgi:diguanylate cyclase (GGDEF)-like protein/PAS domain S-box-containing protein